MDPNLIKSIIVIHGNDDAGLPELNVQASDDLEKLYEFEGKLRLKKVTSFIENNDRFSARHQYYLEIESIDKFKEESS
jgi:CMP-N-acetylneuraminic acid synthetase